MSDQNKPQLIAKFVHGKIVEPDVHSIDGDMQNGEFMRSHGIHWLTAGFIMIGESENKNRLV
jgi:hypothetical protein